MKLLVIIGLFFSLAVQAQTIFERLTPPLIAAHQGGYPWKGRNNTLEKFNAALKDGADILEMDTQVTKDGVVIVFHDEDLKEDTKCSGKIIDKTFAEIQECPYNNGYKIEKFEDVLKSVNGEAIVNAEFKTQDVVVPAIQLVQRFNAYDWVYFQAKGERARYLLARQTDNKVALLYKTKTDIELDWALSHNDEYLIAIEMEKNMATPNNIAKVHNAKKLVTVNSWRYGSLGEIAAAACNKVYKLGVDIAVANNIKSCFKQRKSHKK